MLGDDNHGDMVCKGQIYPYTHPFSVPIYGPLQGFSNFIWVKKFDL